MLFLMLASQPQLHQQLFRTSLLKYSKDRPQPFTTASIVLLILYPQLKILIYARLVTLQALHKMLVDSV